MRISDWSSDVCSSDLSAASCRRNRENIYKAQSKERRTIQCVACSGRDPHPYSAKVMKLAWRVRLAVVIERETEAGRSEEHTSELQSLMRISYAVFCLKKKTKRQIKYD